jgi:oxaloacetate decarboxylase alpha subunit
LYFRDVRKKYAKFEGSLKGVDSRILTSQVPGGMLTNMESQLKEQGATDKFDEVLKEIPKVRQDLGYIPLVTPTSQIVGTQAVLNVLAGERYKTITKETAGVLKGEYGAAPAELNKELQQRVLEGAQPITCRPADLLEPEMDKLIAEVEAKAKAEGVKLADQVVEDALINGLFAQVGWKFIANRHNPSAFEPAPGAEPAPVAPASVAPAAQSGAIESYSVNVDGRNYNVVIGPANTSVSIVANDSNTPVASASSGGVIESPMAGTILKVNVTQGANVNQGDVVVIMEAMKMETEVRSKISGVVTAVNVKNGDTVAVGEELITL